MTMRRLRLVFIALFLLASRLEAQDFIPPMPSDLEHTKISLLTVGLGEDLYARYGHTMIRVEDPSNQLDYMVNWGLFDFSDPWFIPKFFRGILIYRMGFSPGSGTIRYYRDVERRPVVQDELNLTSAQKRRLMDKIIWNAQPQNVTYPYQYFRNNCATMPRDYLDDAVGGRIKIFVSGAVVPMTYRDYVRANLSINPFVGWGLDVIFNGDNDHKLTKWQEMFYPPKLREHLASLPSFDDKGVANTSIPLLTNHRVLVDLPEPDGRAISGYHLTWIVAGLPLLLIDHSIRNNNRRGRKPSPRWHYRLFGLVSIWWGLTTGFFGLTHFSAWLFSSHTDLHRNLNILIFWPVDMLVLIPGVQMGLFGRDFRFPGVLKIGFWRRLAIFHIGLLPVYAIIAWSGFFAQDVSRVVGYMVPLSLVYYYVMIQLISGLSSEQ